MRRVDPKLAVAYVRASRRDQKLSPDAQRADLTEWAAAQGVTIAAFHVDTISGAKPVARRPGLCAALVDLRQRRAGVLLAVRRDRLFRDLEAAVQVSGVVRRAGASIVVVNGPPAGDSPELRLFQQMSDAYAEFEWSVNGQRTATALQEKLRRGEAAGGTAPLGYRIEAGRIVPCPEEQAALRRVADLRRAGVSWPRVTATLRREGFAPRKRSWHAATLGRALARQTEEGDVVQ